MAQVLPSGHAERKNLPLYQVLFGYFPNALQMVTEVAVLGNEQHNPGQPVHWAFDKSNDHADCIIRHQVDFDQVDEATGLYHAANVAWRALAQLETLAIRDGATPGRAVVRSPAEPVMPRQELFEAAQKEVDEDPDPFRWRDNPGFLPAEAQGFQRVDVLRRDGFFTFDAEPADLRWDLSGEAGDYLRWRPAVGR